jgi:hypothetical protein
MRTKLKPGTRVAWKSGKQWKTGSVLLAGDPTQKTKKVIAKEFTLAYESQKTPKTDFYYIAADSPLFQPGYTVHCVSANHLQHEETSWPYKEKLLDNLSKKDLKTLAQAALKTQQRLKKRCPQEIQDALHQLNPQTFPL